MRLSSKQKQVLKAIGICATFAAAIIAPNILQILKPATRKKKYRYKKAIQKLVNDKIIYLSDEEINLTKKGYKLLQKIQTEDVAIKPKDKWDGVWHLVCYDIPEKFKKERDYFRQKLIESGFYKIQLSLWVYPYECKEEIAVIAQNLRIAPFVAYLNTDYLPRQDVVVRYFKLS